MPKFFVETSKTQELSGFVPEDKIVGLENFVLMNPGSSSVSSNIDSRSNQMTFANNAYFNQITDTQYAKKDKQFLQKAKANQVKVLKAIKTDLARDISVQEKAKLLEDLEIQVQKLADFEMEIGKTVLGKKRGFRDGVLESRAFVLKQLKIKYGIEWAQWEIIAAKFAGLTGIIAPNTSFAVNAQSDDQNRKFEDTKQQVLQESTKSVQILSQRLKGYYDLSSFLLEVVNQYSAELLDPENIDQYLRLRSQILEIKKQEKEEGQKTDQTKIKKRDCYLEIYKMLPQGLKDQIDEMRVVSGYIGNWDMFNWDLDNCGLCVRHTDLKVKSKNDISGTEYKNVISIEPAMVDFGNSLFNGFGGVYKYLSDTANQPAKKRSDKPKDYDPEIDKKDSVIEELMGFANGGAVDLLSSRLPRRLPFQDLFSSQNEQMVKFLSDSKDFDINQVSQGTLRGLYRISLIDDRAIESLVKKWYVFENEELFNKVDKNNQSKLREELSPDYLIKLMQNRRDDIVNQFQPLIERYELHHAQDAMATKNEVNAAAFDVASVAPESFGPNASVTKQQFSKLAQNTRPLAHFHS